MRQFDYSKTQFILSSDKPKHWVEDKGNEVAFVGRSNVGKSTAINTITNRRGLAKTSKTPGRTQHLVFFNVEDDCRLVDLPGYGYAKTPLVIKQRWEKAITTYLSERQSLSGIVIPMDIRRPYTDLDQQMVEWAQSLELPIHVLLTKSDKLSRGKATTELLKAENDWAGPRGISLQLFSALNRVGIEEARNQISTWLSL